MTAICKSCGERLRFRNQRGNRLSSYVCECGGTFGLGRYDDQTNTYVLVQPKPNHGKGVQCAICGRKRRYPSGNVKRLDQDTEFTIRRAANPNSQISCLFADDPQPLTILAGSIICWHHETTFPIVVRA